MNKSKKNWILLGIAVLAVFFIIKMAVETTKNESADKNKVFCSDERGDFCTEEYSPVCGWYDSSKIQCIRYPCAQEYSNGCNACKDRNVAYYTKSVCPN